MGSLPAGMPPPPHPCPCQEKENIPSGILGNPVFTMNSSQYLMNNFQFKSQAKHRVNNEQIKHYGKPFKANEAISRGRETRRGKRERERPGRIPLPHFFTLTLTLFGGCSPGNQILGLFDFHSHASLAFPFTLGHKINFNCTEQRQLWLCFYKLRAGVNDSTREDSNTTCNMWSIFANFYVRGVSQNHMSQSAKSLDPLELMLDLPNTDLGRVMNKC